MLIAKGSLSLLVIIVYILYGFKVNAQNSIISPLKDTVLVYNEIHVQVMLREYKSFYVDVLYTSSDLLYINLEDLFKTLNIDCFSKQNGDILNGFIDNEGQKYEIDFTAKKVIVDNEQYNSPNCLVKEMGTLYIESSLLTKAFGISMIFNYRSLSIQLTATFELPIIKQQRIEKLRDNIAKLNREKIADTSILRNSHFLKLGTLDWSIGSSQATKALTQNYLGLSFGTEFLYGEAQITATCFSGQKFDNRQLYYIWRWVDNSKTFIRQATVGRISTHTISYINSPLIGAEIRNSPTLARKATGHYTIHEFTEPNWIVELYINNVLIDFIKTDA